MEEDLFNIPLSDVKRELRRGIIECQKRSLTQSAKWLAEMSHGLGDVDCEGAGTSSCSQNVMSESGESCQFLEGIALTEYDNYFLAKSYFDVREYDRAAYFVRNCESSVPRFLHLYATYMSREKRRLDSTTDRSNLNDTGHVRELTELLAILRSQYSHGLLDGYGIYLYGVVLKAVNLNKGAIQMFIHAIRLAPMLWAAYVELAPLIMEKDKMLPLNFGGHWMRHFFVAHSYIEMYLNDEGLKAYEDLQHAGFRKCVYVTSQMALAYHNKRDVDRAIEIFQTLQEVDPYRLENIDTYSNLLFVKELKTEMAQLAHKAVSINKYCPETCCVVGNYYSIRSDHQMAIVYFQRALKLNPKYLSAWTLMGHEFMELKNTNAAIQSYRKAVEVNKRDYRAWYGLGQSYEILKMHYYSLYYFKIAHQLRPYDSRMLVALGETYEKLEKFDNAIKCYWKACDVGDIEAVSMCKLAGLYEKRGEYEDAVQCYIMYCDDERAATDKQSLYHGFMTLANYYESKGQFDKASHYAYKCLESDERKSEAKALLKTIENKRSGKVATSEGEANSSTNANVIAADTSSDDDMEMELSDYKYLCSDYVLSCQSDFKESKKTPAATGYSTTNSHLISTAADMSLNESEMAASSSTNEICPSTSTAATFAIGQQTEKPIEARDSESNDDEQNSMEISSISID
ncbi:cell division cycle protein 23 homolog [Rhagoletis pomonella]|uniref:cell division cycle protein 23 homolog n=1 Tax=Rhagoletis pomonella TaxID=28610 RepID=UPI00177ED74B|nr:cell division cycle protein 23 homolog [Rhagoletis pomonella]